MRRLVLLFLLLFLVGWAGAEAIDVVKHTRNCQGLTCDQIPQIVKNKLGYQNLVANWMTDRMDGFDQVSLRISAQKDILADGVYMSYRWQPQWVWKVNSKDHRVRPANKLAENWMEGKL